MTGSEDREAVDSGISFVRPRDVPSDLTEPKRAYKVRAWLAVAGLLSFVVVYLVLTGGFAWLAYRHLRDALGGGRDAFVGYLAAIPAAFFAIFLAKGLFFVKRDRDDTLVEVTAEEQPKLFDFLTRIADEVRAPRPHRVYLSARVNAGVFYDLSLLNLLLPTKKNLVIGLGLVNVLTVGELTAVLAHEFGHFAQRTMTVGRWVYISQQVAAAIIAKRDVLDRFLLGLSRVDLRLAWIGWVMRLVVWSIRSVLDSVFRLVVLAERALAREMELQADLVSVSLCGSDALVHALHKLQAADEAWEGAVNAVVSDYARGRRVPDLFALQTRVMEHVRRVLDDDTHGQAPPLPAEGRESHRVFEQELGQPPKMWSTHPPNREREDNAKRRYIRADLDERSAWAVFREPAELRVELTGRLLEHCEVEADKPPEVIDAEEAMASIDADFNRPSMDRRYRGVYLGRSPVRHTADADALRGELDEDRDAIVAALDALYPESLGDEVEQLRALEREHATLEALHDGFLTAPAGVIQHRGRAMRRRELPAAIDLVERERDEARRRLIQHDLACRTAHSAAAALLRRNWKRYHGRLLALLHYATHAEADLRDAHGHLENVFSVVIADGRVSARERTRLVAAALEVHEALSELDGERGRVVLPAAVCERLEISAWTEVLPKVMDLGAPGEGNIGDWLQVVDGWVGAYAGPLGALRRTALDLLLETEDHVARCLREGEEPGSAPEPAKVPSRYRTLLEGQERPRQKKLDWWDRFQLAEGIAPSVARFAVAATVVGAVLALGGTVGSAEVVVYNGLDTQVEVRVGDASTTLGPFGKIELDLPRGDQVAVETRTADGRLIESFSADVDNQLGRYVYSVAAACPMVAWTAAYGSASAPPERMLGAERWFPADVNHYFEEPPTKISTEGSGGTRSVLTALGKSSAVEALAALSDDEQRRQVALAHARWDDLHSPRTGDWMGYAASQEGFAEVLAARLGEQPNDVVLLRLEQDSAPAAERKTVCARHIQRADASPADFDWQYLRLRCVDDSRERDRQAIELHEKAPKHPWLAFSAGFAHAGHGAWEQALPLLGQARAAIPFLRTALADQQARVRRAAALRETEGALPSVTDLAATSDLLARHLALESGSDVPDGPLKGYAHLAAGELSRAAGLCEGAPPGDDGAVCKQLLPLLAASDGAPREWFERALAIAPGELDQPALWAGYALAQREGRDVTPYRERIEAKLEEEAAAVVAFTQTLVELTTAEASETFEEKLGAAEAKLDGVQPALRGEAYVFASVVAQDRVPPRWRALARALLFADERPHLR